MPRKKRVVEEANKLDDETYQTRFIGSLDDILDNSSELRASFTSSAKLALQDKQYDVQDVSVLEQCFQLIRSSSFQDYKNSSIKWSPAEKRKEMQLPDMRYLLVHETGGDQTVKAFVSFMITYEDGHEVIYIYEIHISDVLRGKGIGTRLIAAVEDVARRAELSKVMLTVFVSNSRARNFYSKLGYVLDEFSPAPRKLRSGVVKEPDYQILSKSIPSSGRSKRRRTG